MRLHHYPPFRALLPALALAATLLVASWGRAEFEQIHKPSPDDPMAVSIYRLDNGLTVYLTENHQSPRFQVEVAVRVGAKHDPRETTGLAHYFEHLMFKGTQRMGTLDFEKERASLDRVTALYEKRFGETDPAKRREIYAEIDRESQRAAEFAVPNELTKVFTAMGEGGLNAHTSWEETVFNVNLPSNRLRHWARVEADRFATPVMRLFHTELETVYEEKNGSLDSKSNLIFDAVLRQLYKKHPYGTPILGTVEHLKNPSIARIQMFFETHYVPSNMAVLISGDIDKAETMRVIDEEFSSLKAKPAPKPRVWEEAPLKRPERVKVQYPGEEYVLLAFRTASRGHPDFEALTLLDMTLDNSVAGLINLKINQAQKARQAGSFPMMYNDHGAQMFFGVPKAGQSLEDLEQLLLDQIELVIEGKFEDWVIPAIINDFKKSRKSSLESDDSRVATMRKAFIAGEDWDHAIGQIARMERLGKDDVTRVARKYFRGGYVSGWRNDGPHEPPKIEKPKIDKIEIDPSRQSPFAREVLAMPVQQIEPSFIVPDKDYRIVDKGDGRRVYLAPNPINDLFSLTITVDMSLRQDSRLPIAVKLLEKSGAGPHSAEALQKEWYKLGTDFSIRTGSQETNITLSGLDENFAASVALLMALLDKPTADAATLAELVAITKARRADSKKDPSSIHGALSLYNRLGDRSRYLLMPTNETMDKLTVEELHGLTRGLLGFKHAVAYTGTLPRDKALAIIETMRPTGKTLKNPPPYEFLAARAPEKTETYFVHKDMAQARIRIEFGREVYDEKRRPAIQIYDEYFAGGMASVVFQELRESRGLAYSAGARYLTADRKGDRDLMIGVVICQPDKAAEAVEAFIEILDELKVAPELFAETRDSIVNRYRASKIQFSDVIDVVQGWERLGLDVDPRRWRFEQILGAEIKTLRQFHRKQIRRRPKLISIVGDRNRIDMKRIERIGSIKDVKIDELFVY